MAAIQLNGRCGPVRRDLEPLDADVTGLKVEALHDRRPSWHCPQRDRLPLRAAGSNLHPLVVLSRHDENGIARLDHIGGMLNSPERLLFRAWVGVCRTGCGLIHHKGRRVHLAGHIHRQG